MKNKISVFLRIIVSFGLLGLLFWLMRNDLTRIYAIIAASNIKFIICALTIFFVEIIMLAYRMKIIFLGEELKLTLSKSLQLTFIGYFFNNFMPTAIGGDIVKAHYASSLSKKKVKSYASVFMDRIIGLYSFLFIAAMALIADQGRIQMASVRRTVLVFLVVGFFGFFIITNRAIASLLEQLFMSLKMFRIGERLEAVYDIVHDYRNRAWVVLKAILISISAQGLYFFAVFLLFISLGKHISLGNVFLIMSVVVFASMIPSIGGLGVREGAIVAFFAPLVGRDAAFAISLLVLLGLIIASLFGGIVYLWWGVSGIKVLSQNE